MPKPILSLTKKQWTRLLERVLRREQFESRAVRGLTQSDRALADAVGIAEDVPDPAMDAARSRALQGLTRGEFQSLGRGEAFATPTMGGMMDVAPPHERTFGRLMAPGQGDLPGRPVDLPHPLAVKAYAGGKGGLAAPSEIPPPVDLLTRRGGGRYERRVFKPVKAEGERVKSAVDEVGPELNAKQRKELMEASRKKERAQLDTKQVKGKMNVAIEDLQSQAMLLDSLWRFVGMGRSTTGKYWDMLRKGSRGKKKTESARDYFIRAGLRWLNDPDRYAKNNSREAKSLERIYREFMDAIGESE